MANADTMTGQTPEGWLTDSWYFVSTSKDLKPGTQHRMILLNQL